MNFVTNSLIFVSHLCLLFVEFLGKSNQVFSVSNFLFLSANFDGSEILLKFTLINSVFVFNILEGDLSLLFQIGKLILILEVKMLTTLLIDL